MNNILVTGGSGFLGAALVRRLSQNGNKVFVLDRHMGDITDPITFNINFKADVVFHLAARSFVPESWINAREYVNTNVMGTQNALDYCCRHGAKLVFASTYIYGEPQCLPISESHPINVNNPYALSKYLSEQLCSFYFHYRNISSTVLRIFNVYGPQQKSEFLVPTIVRQVLREKNIQLRNLSPRRDYVFLDDVIDAFLCAGKLTNGFNVLNIGSGKSLSVAELVSLIQTIAKTELPIINEGHSREQEIFEVVADCKKASEILGWYPRTKIDDGLKAVLTAAKNIS